MFAIEAKDITKSYRKTTALRGVSFEVEHGEIFGIIGADGAGKSTLFRILTTLLLPDSGTASVEGLNIVEKYKEIRKIVGYMPGKFSLYQDLSVEENINFFATLFNTSLQENYDIVKDIYSQLEPFKNRKAAALSGGMKQKLALCCALIHRPKILFLDEPTTGVDPVSRKEFWGILKNLKQDGIAIMVSTSYMDEASLCDRVALINNGAFLSVDTTKNLIKDFRKPLYAASSENMFRLLKDIREIPEVESCFTFGDLHHIIFKNQDINIEEIMYHLLGKGHTNLEIKKIKASIEDCYMLLEGKNNEE
ncbi:MAG: ABC transporter ATP-binding protein [Bacteroidales bacterium]|nr:ABC transporter ATP-binding protein [Bacteroidales bacterium]